MLALTATPAPLCADTSAAAPSATISATAAAPSRRIAR